MVDESREHGSRITTWAIPRAVKMMTFVFARASHEESFAVEGLPEVRAFSSLGGFVNEERVRLLGAHVVDSLDYFQAGQVPGSPTGR